MIERSDKVAGILYNSAVLIGPEGYFGKYQKMYLPTHSVFEEKRYYRPGCKIPVFETQVGKLGMIICYDIYFPEISRLLSLKGANLIVCTSASPSVRRGYFETLTAARAIENTVFIIYSNLVGTQEDLVFWGGSQIIDPLGNLLKKAPYYKESMIFHTYHTHKIQEYPGGEYDTSSFYGR